MKYLRKSFLVYILILFITGCSGGGESSDQQVPADGQKSYYGVEVNGVLCGYAESTTRLIEKDGKKIKQKEENLFIMLTLLGSNVNTETKMLSYIDPATGKCNYFSIDAKQGDIEKKVKIEIKDNTAIIQSFISPEPKKIEMTRDVIFGDEELFGNLKKDFTQDGVKEKSYNILDAMDGKIRKTTFTKLGSETVTLAGKSYDAVIFDQFIKETGLKSKWWFDLDNLEMLKVEASDKKVFKTDRKVVDKIKVADMDESIFTKANVSIADIHAITYMKLKVVIEPMGVQLAVQDLNAPGQRFTGTVKDNLIEGIFEIEHKRYNGEDAPPFPADYGKDESLQKYLEPTQMIESSDPVLIKKAQEITRGAGDSWEAATRLSKWVAENITYGIPGGGTARGAYDMKAGECGAHSFLLAAFCRSVGIPARVVWGAMYAPNYGGGFGQHAWNEIYMGPAGWIPVDNTAMEEDFVDSGHIRIAEYQSALTSFNGKKIEVLDYRAGQARMGGADVTPEGVQKYIGKYTDTASKSVAKLKTQGGGLIVVLPGNVSLPLDEPDENGFRYCKIARHVFFEFTEDEPGKVTEMRLHQLLSLSKKKNAEEEGGTTPGSLAPYLGTYYLAAANLDVRILEKSGNIALEDPQTKKIVKFFPNKAKDKWISEDDTKVIYFELDDQGQVKEMKIETINIFKRK